MENLVKAKESFSHLVELEKEVGNYFKSRKKAYKESSWWVKILMFVFGGSKVLAMCTLRNSISLEKIKAKGYFQLYYHYGNIEQLGELKIKVSSQVSSGAVYNKQLTLEL